MSSFGSAFGTAPPSLDERMHTIANQLENLVALLAGGGNLPRPTPPAGFSDDQAVAAVQAVQGLKGNATATEIADALAARLAPATPASEASGVLAAVEKLSETLDFRLRGLGQAFGAAGTAEIKNITVTETGLATQATLATLGTESTLAAIKRGITGDEQRLDYDGSNNLIYSGKAPNGTATTATTWTISKLSYTGANLTRVQQLSGAWDSRTSLGW